jgi:glutathione synthase/RimK-type ligase-like ATP-grasp enzyme
MSARPRIALVTCAALPSLYGDEQALPASFAAAGVDAEPVVWSASEVAWSRYDAVVLRSTWDYFERIDEFRSWLDRIEREGVRLYNPVPLVRWNFDKRYLAELQSRGVRIVPTRFCDAGARVDLPALVAERGWSQAIVKPAVSGGAYRTHRFAAADAGRVQDELDEILRTSGALVQPFLDEIVRDGEWSLLSFDGVSSHAAVKRPATGDFRVQAQFGGTHEPADPPAAVRRAATAILGELPTPTLYARIDGIVRDGEFELMEVEVIEPYLFLPGAPGAVDRYVTAVAAIARDRGRT